MTIQDLGKSLQSLFNQASSSGKSAYDNLLPSGSPLPSVSQFQVPNVAASVSNLSNNIARQEFKFGHKVNDVILPLGSSEPGQMLARTLARGTNQVNSLRTGTPTNQPSTVPPGYTQEALSQFTPGAQDYLKNIPVQAFSDAEHKKYQASEGVAYGEREGVPPKISIDTNRIGSDTAVRQEDLVHEYLHSTPRPIGFDYENFMRDVNGLQKTNPTTYKRLAKFATLYDKDNLPPDRIAEELFAQAGAMLGDGIFTTPLGKYYDHILNKEAPLNENNL